METLATLLYPRPAPVKGKKNPLHLWGLGPVESSKQMVIHQLNEVLGWPARETSMSELVFYRFHGTPAEIRQVYGPDALPRLEAAIVEELSAQPENTMVPVEDELFYPEAIKIMTRTGVTVWFHSETESDKKMEQLGSLSGEDASKKIIHVQTGGRSTSEVVVDILRHPLMKQFQA